MPPRRHPGGNQDRRGLTPAESFFFLTLSREFHASSSQTPRLGSDPVARPSFGGNDNADYSADGKFIYFESGRSGKREIWRVPSDGAGPDDSLAERVSAEEGASRFPHPSPDGKWIAFMTATPGGDARDVTIRVLPAPAQKAVPAPSQEIVAAVGGQGMMHRNSWSPDSTRIAFASYEPR